MHRSFRRMDASRSRQLRRSAACGAVMTAAALLGACRRAGILDPRGPVSGAERLILLNATGIMLVVVVPVIMITLAFAWWYRASNKKAAYEPEWSYSGQIEMVVWSIPAMVVILLAGVGWTGSHQLDPAQKLVSEKKPVRIQAISLDWKWLFIYPDQGVATVNELVIPAGTPVEFMLSSATVMNSFFVPRLGSQIYTMAGMTTQLSLEADNPGTYPGISAQFSGAGFSGMTFAVVAVSPGQFAGWVATTRQSGTALDAADYAGLAKPSQNNPATTYRQVPSQLFETIVSRSAPVSKDSRSAPAAAPPFRSRN